MKHHFALYRNTHSDHPQQSRTRSPATRRVAALLCGSLIVLPAVAEAATPSPSSSAGNATVAQAAAAQHAKQRGKIYLGSNGNVGQMVRKTRHAMSRHHYTSFSSNVPRGRMITVGSSGSWSSLANMRRGAPLYRDIVRWAKEIRSWHRKTLVAYSHEPETTGNMGKGSAASFKQAFHRVVSIFRAHGARNVLFTWQATAWSFRTSRSDRIHASKWYPGNRWVDVVGADAYNWNTCGEGRDKWVPFRTLAKPVLRFARAHHKKAAFPEFASNKGRLRANWVRHAHQYLARHDNRINAAYYFQRGPTNPANKDCRWALTKDREFRAYGQMARDHAHFRR